MRVIRDSLYGYITLSDTAYVISQHNVFQRLKQIRQLGAADLVFPLVGHRRYEHSLGVAHLAVYAAKAASKNAGQTLSSQQILWIELAALLHDVGHGPFSHVFDAALEHLQQKGLLATDAVIRHEERSTRMVQWLLTSLNVNLQEIDIFVIKYMIDPTQQPAPDHHLCPLWLTEIVTNTIHGMDVDKMDYLARDYMSLHGCTTQTLKEHPVFGQIGSILDSSTVLNGHWVFDLQHQNCIEALIQIRQTLHHELYNYPLTKAVTCMVQDVLEACAPVLGICKMISLRTDDHILSYCAWTDTILEQVVNSTASIFTPLRQLVMDIYSQDATRWYQHVGDFKEPQECQTLEFQITWQLPQMTGSLSFHDQGQLVTMKPSTSPAQIVYRIFKKHAA